MMRQPPRSTLFPSPTLFRSRVAPVTATTTHRSASGDRTRARRPRDLLPGRTEVVGLRSCAAAAAGRLRRSPCVRRGTAGVVGTSRNPEHQSAQHLHFVLFFNDAAASEIYSLSLPDALPISGSPRHGHHHPSVGFRGPYPRPAPP